MTASIDHFGSTTTVDNSATDLEQVLHKIANDITIQADLTIIHSQQDSITVPAELQQRFEYLPDQVQHNYLQVKLQQLLYENYYCPIPDKDDAKDNDPVENKAIQWSNSDFLQQLRKNNHSQGYYQSGWLIVGETEEGFLQVKKDGLTLHIRNFRHLRDVDQSAKIGDVVAVKMPPQLVEPKFYIAVGTAGSINHLEPGTDTQIVDIYFNLSCDGALVLMDRLTNHLNAIEIPFHFKVLYKPKDYVCCDTAILSFAKDEYDRVRPIIETIYQENQAYFHPKTPLFNKYLAPGLSVAERPLQNMNFAQNRCQIIAEALIYAWQQDETSPADKLKYICDHFRQENINLQQPYLNPNSTDIYSVIIDS